MVLVVWMAVLAGGIAGGSLSAAEVGQARGVIAILGLALIAVVHVGVIRHERRRAWYKDHS